MLTYISNEGKSFEQRYSDAITQIPLLTDEWTDFNPSDPGIAILEVLSGFSTLQQDKLMETPPEVMRNLLAMTGFRARRGRAARLLLSAQQVGKRGVLPPNHRFKLGDLSFETNRSIPVDNWRLKKIYGKKDGQEEWKDFSHLTDRETAVPVKIFGDVPCAKDAVYFVSDSLPEPKKETIFYFTLSERYNRNPLLRTSESTFAEVEWECYTKEGWQKIDVRDHTNAFLRSGEVKMWMPGAPAAVCPELPEAGYCIRASLEKAEYDVCPKLTGVEAFLFEVWQKRTLSECHSFGRASEAVVHSGIMEETYVNVFCREAKSGSYRRYEYTNAPDLKGRYYEREEEGHGTFKITFSKKDHGFGPERSRECVRVLVYTEDVMRRYRLGRVLGYDHQKMDLPYQQIVTQSFCIVARRTLEDGSEIYDFVRPERDGEGALYYHLLESDGRIEIEDAGDFIGAELFLGAVATHSGSEGNIRAGNVLISEGETGKNVYYNPGEGTGGAFRETLEEVRTRFLKDMEEAYTAVTAADYEALVRSTPGLCIHKAHAYMDEAKNLIRIAVKPGTDETYPRLPETYQNIIKQRIEARRLLTTRVELIQPVYTPVNVSGTIYVKLHYENSREEIEATVREKINYLESDKNFGERLHFDEVFHAIEMLECVEYVYELSIRPQNMNAAHMEDADICPDPNCLLYPGSLSIEAITFES